jgi:uncharacterized membrane protein YhdT
LDNSLAPSDIFYVLGDVYKVHFWQSIFNFVTMLNILVAFVIFGLITWLITAYKLILKKSSNKYFEWFELMSSKWTTGMSILKILLVYICVSYIDQYEAAIQILNESNCSDEITNQCFRTMGTSLIYSRYDNMFVFKLTMLMLAFEIINFLTPKIVHLRRHQGHHLKID